MSRVDWLSMEPTSICHRLPRQPTGGTLNGGAINLLSRNAANLPTTGSIALFAVHGRWLADEEVAQLGRTLTAPWQLFEPQTHLRVDAACIERPPDTYGPDRQQHHHERLARDPDGGVTWPKLITL